MLAIIFVIHVTLCIMKSKNYVFTGFILLLQGIFMINAEYFLNLPQFNIFIWIIGLCMLYTIFSLKLMTAESPNNILKWLIANKSVYLDLDYFLIVCEEYIFRVILCYIVEALFHEHITIISQLIIMGFVFTIVHSFKNNTQRYEFFIFSILLSWVFVYTHSLLIVVLIHIIRNYSILCVTKTLKSEEVINGIN